MQQRLYTIMDKAYKIFGSKTRLNAVQGLPSISPHLLKAARAQTGAALKLGREVCCAAIAQLKGYFAHA